MAIPLMWRNGLIWSSYVPSPHTSPRSGRCEWGASPSDGTPRLWRPSSKQMRLYFAAGERSSSALEVRMEPEIDFDIPDDEEAPDTERSPQWWGEGE